MSGLWRYFRLYGYFMRFSFSKAMEFRADFFFRVVMDAVFYAVHIAFFKVLFLHTPELAGWNEGQLMIFITGYFVCDAIMMITVSGNVWWIPTQVNRGDLDYYLVRPVSSLFFLSFREFAASSILNLILAIGLLCWAIAQYPAELSAAKLVLYGLLLVNGAFMLYLSQIIAILPCFWTHSAKGFQQISHELGHLAEKPDRIFRGMTRRVLTTVIPMAMVISFPTRLLLEEFSWTTLGHLVAVTGVFFGILVWTWNRGLRSYSSASS